MWPEGECIIGAVWLGGISEKLCHGFHMQDLKKTCETEDSVLVELRQKVLSQQEAHEHARVERERREEEERREREERERVMREVEERAKREARLLKIKRDQEVAISKAKAEAAMVRM